MANCPWPFFFYQRNLGTEGRQKANRFREPAPKSPGERRPLRPRLVPAATVAALLGGKLDLIGFGN
jgi:hypothetical protein